RGVGWGCSSVASTWRRLPFRLSMGWIPGTFPSEACSLRANTPLSTRRVSRIAERAAVVSQKKLPPPIAHSFLTDLAERCRLRHFEMPELSFAPQGGLKILQGIQKIPAVVRPLIDIRLRHFPQERNQFRLNMSRDLIHFGIAPDQPEKRF